MEAVADSGGCFEPNDQIIVCTGTYNGIRGTFLEPRGRESARIRLRWHGREQEKTLRLSSLKLFVPIPRQSREAQQPSPVRASPVRSTSTSTRVPTSSSSPARQSELKELQQDVLRAQIALAELQVRLAELSVSE